MKKGLSVMLAVCLCFACLLVASPAAYAQDARAMPVPFTFTDRVVLTPNLQDSFPLGTAEFDVTITGLYDAQGDHVYSIQSATCVYRGGINCTENDMEVSTWTTSTDRGYVFWELVGTLTFSWTSPVTGVQYESVFYHGPDQSFRAYDYME